MRLDQSIFCS